jgi:hypothetical protein
MTIRPRVRCDDAGVRAGLLAWLDGLRLDLPAALTFDITVGDPPSIEQSVPVFEQPEVRFYRGPGGRGVSVSWQVAPAFAWLPSGSMTAWVHLSPSAALQLESCSRTFLKAVVIVLARQVGWYHLHAATAIDPDGRGWLIAGNARAGKSTTAALLAAAGWRVGTDDAAFLEWREPHIIVHTCRAPIALRAAGRRLLARVGGVALAGRGKVGYWPEDLGGVWTPLVRPEIIIFTSVGRGRTAAKPLGRLEAATELVRWSSWVVLEPDLAQAHLDLLARVTRQARCYRVTLGRDLFARPNRLIELVT